MARPLRGSRSPHTTLLAGFEAVAAEFAFLPIEQRLRHFHPDRAISQAMVFYSACQLAFLQFQDEASRWVSEISAMSSFFGQS